MMKIIKWFIIITVAFLGAQEEINDTLQFRFEPDSFFLHVGETAEVTIKLLNPNGELSQNPFFVYGQPRRALEVTPRISDSTGIAHVKIKPHKPGKLKLRTRSISVKREDRVYGSAIVEVPKPPLKYITFKNPESKLYVGTSKRFETEVYDEAQLLRKDVDVSLTVSDTKIAEFDALRHTKNKKARAH